MLGQDQRGLSDALTLDMSPELFSGGGADPLARAIPQSLDENLHTDTVLVVDLFRRVPVGTPVHKSMASATVLLPRQATALVTLRYQSGAVGMSDNGLKLAANAFTTMDLGGTLPIAGGVQVQAGVKNLFDRDYYYWEGFPEAGRTAYATVRYVF